MIANLYKWIGKNNQFEDVVSGNINKVVGQTLERDTFFLSKILNLDVTDARTRLIITKDSTPRNKDETTLCNIKEMLTMFQKKYEDTRHQSNDLLNWINYVYSHNKDIKFDYQTVDKKAILKSQALKSKRLIVDEISEAVEQIIHKQSFEKIVLYINFFVDIYNIRPFTAQNDVSAALLLYLLILKADLHAFRLISFFELLYENYDMFQTELKTASYNWNEGFAQTLGFTRFMLKLFTKGYEKTLTIIKDYKFDQHLNKGDNIENTISKLPDTFTKDEIRLIHPYVSESTINRTLIKLREEGIIRPLGKGRSAKWIRVYKGYNHPND